ncbi:MAG TPA: nuclear transport factor 2 family protein [Mycobacteriales bacterium]|nr:nuclear transport factor 2 family protein [Mycobacteriales bacterium]
MSAQSIEMIAEKVRVALDSADLEQFADYLDPKVTWGAPGDSSPSCQNRNQVLTWYANGRAAGRRGQVRDIRTRGDKILVSLAVTSPEDGAADRWQVLTVANGLVTDIRGYEVEADAAAAAGLS